MPEVKFFLINYWSASGIKSPVNKTLEAMTPNKIMNY